MKTNNLTIKQEAFAQAYVKYGDASKAYREVYSFKNKTDKSIWESSSRVLNNVKVQARVRQIQEQYAQVAREKINVEAEGILRHLNILRTARIDEFVEYKKGRLTFKEFDKLTQEQLMCIESIKQNRYGEIELKLHGKEWTIDKINKHIGFYEKHNEQKQPQNQTNDELNDRLLELMNKLKK